MRLKLNKPPARGICQNARKSQQVARITEERREFLLLRKGAVVERGGDGAAAFRLLEKDPLRVAGRKRSLGQRNHYRVVSIAGQDSSGNHCRIPKDWKSISHAKGLQFDSIHFGTGS